jgi:hypothetical protein
VQPAYAVTPVLERRLTPPPCALVGLTTNSIQLTQYKCIVELNLLCTRRRTTEQSKDCAFDDESLCELAG